MPNYGYEVLSETDEYEIVRYHNGIICRALKTGMVLGTRASMDQHLEHPLKTPADWPDIKRRLVAAIPERYPADLDASIETWKTRDYPLILGENCAANGFYWRAREFMGTEALSTAFYDYPEMIHEIMEFFADFIIETSRPVLEKVGGIDYFTLNEDLSMKNGPLIGPNLYKKFIYPHLVRMVEFFKSHGCRYFALDSDGDPTVLIPMFMDAGVDIIWPIERASYVSPQGWRKQFGKQLRMFGGVDKREVAKGPEAIRKHLREFIPLIEEGGFIPTLDHAASPDISFSNWQYYIDMKRHLLAGEFGAI
jgi:uroporphyrinogen decarboxylase